LLIYNQFSIAGSDGIKAHLAADAKLVLEKLLEHHKLLNAKITIPFASFVRFARKDNQHMNEFANTVFDAKEKFDKNNAKMVIQAIGGDYLEWQNLDQDPDNAWEVDGQGKNFYSKQQLKANDEHIYTIIEEEELRKAIEARVNEWHKVTSKFVIWLLKLKPIKFRILDWNDEIYELNFLTSSFSKIKGQKFDISIRSQPLYQAFKLPFGIQTLGVSGRYRLNENHLCVPPTWKKIRILSSLYNAEIYLRMRYIFSSKTLIWLYERRQGIFSQVIQQIKRFF